MACRRDISSRSAVLGGQLLLLPIAVILIVTVAVSIAITIAGFASVELVEHRSNDVGAYHLQAAHGNAERSLARTVGADEEESALRRSGKQWRVSEAYDRWPVDDHNVVGVASGAHQVRHARARKELGRVGRKRSGRDGEDVLKWCHLKRIGCLDAAD